MRAFGKDIFPGHVDPIRRDLLVVLMIGFLTALALVSVGFVLFY